MNENITILKDAYIYGYPIVGMYELLYSQVLSPETKITDFHEFAHTASVASPKTSFVPAPNNDTTYSRAWLDLREEPVVLETPDTNDRYYSIQLLDLFSETITNIGRRKNGTHSQKFVVAGPNQSPVLTENIPVIHCNTTFALAFLRVLITGEQELETVKVIQQGFHIIPLSKYQNKNYTKLPQDNSLPECNTKTYTDFFVTLNKVLELTPMLPEDKDILTLLSSAGIGPNSNHQILSQIPSSDIENACETALSQIQEGGLSFGDDVNHWRVARNKIGNYGTDYLQRSVVWHKGALANQPEESLYPSTFLDSDGNTLDGNNSYRLHFSTESIPPVSQFWSLTMYRFSDAFLVENEINRYSIGDRTKGLIYDKDGSLTIYIQSGCPETLEAKANWLPAPKDKFYMTLRLYGASSSAINGIWKPPSVEKINKVHPQAGALVTN